MIDDFPIDLAVLIIGTIERVEGNQFRWIGREVGCVFLIFALCGSVLDFIGRAVELGGDEPWTGEGIDKLVNLTPNRRGASSATCENSVANGVNFRVGPTCVDEFPMVCTLFINEEGHDFP